MGNLKLLYTERSDRRGTPLFLIIGLLKYFYPNIEIETYHRKKRGILLTYNTFPENIPNSMSIVLLSAGCRLKDNGVPRDINWDRVNHVVFNSEFSKNICLSKYRVKQYSTIHLLGGAHADPDKFEPVTTKKWTGAPHFMCCAKWWKRHFKRFRQIKKLFSEFIRVKYPDAKLHVLGNNITGIRKEDGITYYPKSFHNNTSVEVYKKSNIQLMLSPFDTGPMTLNESLHYRVPFVCSNNCCGREFTRLVDGKCGEVVDIDPQIISYKDCNKYKPFTNRSFYDRDLDYELIMNKIETIINNYNDYTQWEWTDSFSYQSQANKWYDVLSSYEKIS